MKLSKVKKKFKQIFNENFQVPNLYYDITNKIEFSPEKIKRKSFLNIIFLVEIALCIFFLIITEIKSHQESLTQSLNYIDLDWVVYFIIALFFLITYAITIKLYYKK